MGPTARREEAIKVSVPAEEDEEGAGNSAKMPFTPKKRRRTGKDTDGIEGGDILTKRGANRMMNWEE